MIKISSLRYGDVCWWNGIYNSRSPHEKGKHEGPTQVTFRPATCLSIYTLASLSRGRGEFREEREGQRALYWFLWEEELFSSEEEALASLEVELLVSRMRSKMNKTETKCKPRCPLCYGRGTVSIMLGNPKDNKFKVIPCPRM
jgi:hypothetical protein